MCKVGSLKGERQKGKIKNVSMWVAIQRWIKKVTPKKPFGDIYMYVLCTYNTYLFYDPPI